MMQIPTRSQTLLELFKTALSVWKATLKQTMPFALMLAIANLICQIIWQFIVVTGEETSLQHFRKFTIVFGYDGFTFNSNHIGLSMVGFIFFILFVIANIAMVYSIHQAMKGKFVTFKEGFERGYKKILPFLIVDILCGIMIVSGFLLLLIPSVIVLIYILFAPYIIVISDQGILASIQESFKIVLEKWWYTFFTVFIIFVLLAFGFFILYFIITTVLSIFLHLLLGILTGSSPHYLQTYLNFIFDGIFIMISYPWVHSFFLILLSELKVRKSEHNKYHSFKA